MQKSIQIWLNRLLHYVLVTVLDASGKVSPGILRGNTKLVGLYSECAAINAQVEKDRWIIGGYGRFVIVSLHIRRSWAFYKCILIQHIYITALYLIMNKF